jgi:hypothetical protein
MGGGKMSQSMKMSSPGDVISQASGGGIAGGGSKSPGLSQTFKKPKSLLCLVGSISLILLVVENLGLQA